MKIMIINGPNLNFLGIREKDIYGKNSYADLEKLIKDHTKDIICDMYQTNCEGKFIDYLQKAYNDNYDGIVINPGAYSHYSYAIYDAIKSINKRVVEVHISDVNSRDEFRHNLITGKACEKVIMGKGLNGYLEAIDYLKVKA